MCSNTSIIQAAIDCISTTTSGTFENLTRNYSNAEAKVIAGSGSSSSNSDRSALLSFSDASTKFLFPPFSSISIAPSSAPVRDSSQSSPSSLDHSTTPSVPSQISYIAICHSQGILEFKQINEEPLLNTLSISLLVALAAAFLAKVNFVFCSQASHFLWALSVLTAIYFLLRYTSAKEESMLVIAELGIQLQTRLYSGALRNDFVDVAKIKDIVLNEGITTNDVIFYLAIIVEDSDKLVIPFENFPPRLKVLLDIYNSLYAVIFSKEAHRPSRPLDEEASLER